MLAPIILFVYNRPWHTQQTLNALMQNELANQSVLYIYADGPKEHATESEQKDIDEVREIIGKKQWCKEVHIVESEINRGLTNSISGGVTDIVNQYGKIIVLEDDIVTSKGFLKYMNEALSFYENEESVFHISAYMYPLKMKLPETFFLNVSTCWGWGTWKNKWQYFNKDAQMLFNQLHDCSFFNKEDYNASFGDELYNQLKSNANGTLNTWAVKWHTSIYLKRGYCLHPGISMVNNIGLDNSGTNCGNDTDIYKNNLSEKVEVLSIPIVQRKTILKKFHEFYLLTKGLNKSNDSVFHKTLKKVKWVYLKRAKKQL